MSRANEVFTKRPADVRKYDMEFSSSLITGDTITAVTVTEDVGDGALTIASETFSGTLAQVTLSDGTDGENYDVLFQVTTSEGETDECIGELHVRS